MGLILLVHLPYLNYLVHNEELLDIFMWMKGPYKDFKVSYLNEILIGNVVKSLKNFFESKSDPSKFNLFLSLLKLHCLAIVKRILGIKMVKSS